MRREFLLITLLLTIMYPDFACAQSLSPSSNPQSSRINLKEITKKATSGSIESQFQLGFAYQFGKGVDQDINAAVRWYRMAADRGDPSAQNNLGYLYETGPEGIKNLAEAGEASAQYGLGVMYETGHGAKQDLQEALRQYRLAGERGSVEAQTELGEIYELGKGVKVDYQEAIAWYRRAANSGNAHSATRLGTMFFWRTGIERNLA